MRNGLIIDECGNKRWYKDDLRHREDGPAIELTSGTKCWYFNGKRHRLDGPAFKGEEFKCWWENGLRHRLDGPAIEYTNGSKYWCYKGEFIDVSSQEEFERIINLKAFW